MRTGVTQVAFTVTLQQVQGVMSIDVDHLHITLMHQVA